MGGGIPILEGVLILCLIRIRVVSSLQPVSSRALGSWPDLQYQTCVSFCEVGFKAKQKPVGYPHNIHAAMAPMVIIVLHRVYEWVRLLMACPP